MTKGIFVKRFLAAWPGLAIAATLVIAARAFLLEWLKTQQWYVANGSERPAFVLDAETGKMMWSYFISLLPGSIATVCVVDAVMAAALNIARRRNRWIAASSATILFLPFGLVGVAPLTYSDFNFWLFAAWFHVTAVVLFYVALTLLVRIDRRYWGLWRQNSVEGGAS